jgi:hypothetical protein
LGSLLGFIFFDFPNPLPFFGIILTFFSGTHSESVEEKWSARWVCPAGYQSFTSISGAEDSVLTVFTFPAFTLSLTALE